MTSHDYWIFSNKSPGSYPGPDWDMREILSSHKYYLAHKERGRKQVDEGDFAVMRIYGEAYIGTFEVGPWTDDENAVEKYSVPCGSFAMLNVNLWNRPVRQDLVIRDLSTGDVRGRVVKIIRDDYRQIEIVQRTYERLGFGAADGEIVVLEKGLEEAIKPNLAQLGLKAAGDDIQQQFNMGPGVGRSDLICVDGDGNLVVIELKRGLSSDEVIGQVLRYIGFVRENVATPEQEVRGMIIAGDYDEGLRLAASAAGIRLLLVRLG